MRAGAKPLDSPAEAGDKRRTLSLAQKFAVAFLGLVTAVLLINGAIDMTITYRDARVQAVPRWSNTVVSTRWSAIWVTAVVYRRQSRLSGLIRISTALYSTCRTNFGTRAWICTS